MMKKNTTRLEKEITPFQQTVFDLCSKVPRGRVTTYKAIGDAIALARKNSGPGFIYRAVGMALNKNPNAPVVPCHRVVASDGTIGGYGFGLPEKYVLLKSEGIEFDGDRVIDFEKKLWRF